MKLHNDDCIFYSHTMYCPYYNVHGQCPESCEHYTALPLEMDEEHEEEKLYARSA